MYVRIARFEGAEGNQDETIANVREQMKAGRGQPDAPPIKRALLLVDRESGRGASVVFCDTEDDLRKADEFLSALQPGVAGGTRTSVELYEVGVDSDDL
ncbi:MAG: hypothetical protein QOH95_241 [Gaiellaceae bacterium]|jgi:hypothetical protein|nr:hypothetical protein [Gaiellaceae bacterium]